ncbi:MAG: hypothetical protein AAB414_03475 [Patescibacteria group bacterium]
MEDAAQKEQDLHKGVAGNMNQLGHNETPASVNPDDHSALEGIGDMVRIVGAPLDQLVRGEASHIGFKESGPWYRRLMRRISRKKAA